MGVLAVAPEPTSAATVRRAIADELRELRVPADDVLLVATELLGNAIRHGGPAAGCRLNVAWDVEPGAVVVRVVDGSRSPPHLRDTPPDAPGGRGLMIVAALSDAWGVRPVAVGKEVWARVAVGRR